MAHDRSASLLAVASGVVAQHDWSNPMAFQVDHVDYVDHLGWSVLAVGRASLVEDDELAERMDAGRRALMLRGDDESGPYQSPMEDGMQQFHEWYRREMRPS